MATGAAYVVEQTSQCRYRGEERKVQASFRENLEEVRQCIGPKDARFIYVE